jgi:hypothetical protein
VKDEEIREKEIRDAGNGELVAPTTYRMEEDMDVDDEATRMKRKLAQTEDISDLITLYSDIPTDPEALRQACNALRQDVEQFRKRRKGTFDELVSFQAEAGTSGRMGEYRRLIGAGCGGVPPSEVDHVLGMLLEVRPLLFFIASCLIPSCQTLESEEPSSSSTAWAKAS